MKHAYKHVSILCDPQRSRADGECEVCRVRRCVCFITCICWLMHCGSMQGMNNITFSNYVVHYVHCPLCWPLCPLRCPPKSNNKNWELYEASGKRLNRMCTYKDATTERAPTVTWAVMFKHAAHTEAGLCKPVCSVSESVYRKMTAET